MSEELSCSEWYFGVPPNPGSSFRTEVLILSAQGSEELVADYSQLHLSLRIGSGYSLASQAQPASND